MNLLIVLSLSLLRIVLRGTSVFSWAYVVISAEYLSIYLGVECAHLQLVDTKFQANLQSGWSALNSPEPHLRGWVSLHAHQHLLSVFFNLAMWLCGIDLGKAADKI